MPVTLTMRAVVALSMLVLPATALAQDGAPVRDPVRVRPISPVVKFGKWALLAGSLGMNVAAARAHDASERTIDDLESLCRADTARCTFRPDGAYTDPAVEGLFQDALGHDRRARRWLVGGETALLGAAALFIWEFSRPKSPPRNIPFEPELSVTNGSTRLGIRIDW